MELPKTLTSTMTLNLSPRGDVHLFNHHMEGQEGWVTLGTVEVTVDVPQISDAEITNKKIDYLRSGRKEVVEEFTTKLANIDEQLNELLAIPNLQAVE